MAALSVRQAAMEKRETQGEGEGEGEGEEKEDGRGGGGGRAYKDLHEIWTNMLNPECTRDVFMNAKPWLAKAMMLMHTHRMTRGSDGSMESDVGRGKEAIMTTDEEHGIMERSIFVASIRMARLAPYLAHLVAKVYDDEPPHIGTIMTMETTPARVSTSATTQATCAHAAECLLLVARDIPEIGRRWRWSACADVLSALVAMKRGTAAAAATATTEIVATAAEERGESRLCGDFIYTLWCMKQVLVTVFGIAVTDAQRFEAELLTQSEVASCVHRHRASLAAMMSASTMWNSASEACDSDVNSKEVQVEEKTYAFDSNDTRHVMQPIANVHALNDFDDVDSDEDGEDDGVRDAETALQPRETCDATTSYESSATSCRTYYTSMRGILLPVKLRHSGSKQTSKSAVALGASIVDGDDDVHHGKRGIGIGGSGGTAAKRRRRRRRHIQATIVWTKSMQRNLESIAVHLCHQSRPLLLVGPASSGKSMLLKYVARRTGNTDVITLHLDDQIDYKSLLGTYVNADVPGEFKWQDGVLTKAVREGRWLILEDIDLAPTEMLSALPPLLESGKLIVPGINETVHAAAGFRVLASITESAANQKRASATVRSMLDGKGIWSCHRMEEPSRDDVLAVVKRLFPALMVLAEMLVSLYIDTVNLIGGGGSRIRSPATGLKAIRCTRNWSLRDLLKVCSRISAYVSRTEYALPTTADLRLESFPTAFRTRIFNEVFDCFVACLLRPEDRVMAGDFIASALGLPPSLREEYDSSNRPSMSVTSTSVVVGRTAIDRHLQSSSAAFSAQTTLFAQTGHSMRIMEQVCSCVSHNEPVLLVGETGCGKTSLISHVAKQVGVDFIVMNMSQQSEAMDLVGGFKPVSCRELCLPVYQKFESLFRRTWSREENSEFMTRIIRYVHRRKWASLIHGMQVACTKACTIGSSGSRGGGEAQQHEDGKHASKRKRVLSGELTMEWEEMRTSLEVTRKQVEAAQEGKPLFGFVEGALITALRQGQWILLDEINLAPAEALERLLGVLEGPQGSITLSERGDSEPIVRNPGFRLFGAMNPATDVGKKEMPSAVRQRFTELYMPEPIDRNDLCFLVGSYLHSVNEAPVDEIVSFYFEARKMATDSLTDGAEQRPHYSLRTLSRAMEYVHSFAPTYGLHRAVFDGLSMTFSTLLQPDDMLKMDSLIRSVVLKNARTSALRHFPKSAPSANLILFDHFWLEMGFGDVAQDDDPRWKRYVLTPSVRRNLQNITRGVMTRRQPILLQGPTSSGKTSLVEYLAAHTGHHFVRLNNHEHTELSEYLGSYVVDESGKLGFHEGPLVRAVRDGHWVVLDELNLAPTEVLEALNRLLDDNRELYVPELQETIRAHPHFMLFATQNPPGAYGGRKALSKAFRNRFLEINVPDIPDSEMNVILENRCEIPPSFAKKLVEVMRELMRIRQNSRVFAGRKGFITPRDLFRWAERHALTYLELAEDGYMILGERLRTPEERAHIVSVLQKVMKVELDIESMYSRRSEGLLARNSLDQAPVANCSKLGPIVWSESIIRMFVLLSKCIQFKEPVLLVGETGCGKTTVCQILAAIQGSELNVLNCHRHTEASDFLGAFRPTRNREQLSVEMVQRAGALHSYIQQASDPNGSQDRRGSPSGVVVVDTVDKAALVRDRAASLLHRIEADQKLGDSQIDMASFDVRTLGALLSSLDEAIAKANAPFAWEDGALVTAMKAGEMLLVDEISLADDSVLERLNSVLEPERTLVLAEHGGAHTVDKVVAAESFRVMATMNPGGDYGKRELSPALRNRFTEIWVPSIDSRSDLSRILQARLSGSSPASATNMDADDGTSRERAEDELLADRMIDFKRTFETVCRSKFGAAMTLRDLLSWCDFIRISRSHSIDDSVAYAHGAHMIAMDGLKLSLKGSPQMLLEIVSALRDFVRSQLSAIPPSQIDFDVDGLICESADPLFDLGVNGRRKIYADDSSRLVAGRFSISTGPYVPRLDRSAYSLDAPSVSRNASRIIRAMQLRKPLLLEGSPGVGKTSLINAIAKASGHRLVRINLSEQTDMMDLLGSDLPSGGDGPSAFKWADGIFLAALKAGDWILLDELNLANQTVLEGLNSVLDHRGEIYIPELAQTFSCPPSFRLFGAQNPVNEGGGRKKLPRSFLDRFTRVYVDPLDTSDMVAVVSSLFGSIPRDIAQKMVAFNDVLDRASKGEDAIVTTKSFARLGAPWEFNLRDLLRWSELIVASCEGRDLSEGASEAIMEDIAGACMRTVYMSRLRCASDRREIHRVWERVFGNQLQERVSPTTCFTPELVAIGRAQLSRRTEGVSKHTYSHRDPGNFSSRMCGKDLEDAAHCLSRGWMCLVIGRSQRARQCLTRTLSEFTGSELVEISLTHATDISDLIGSFEQIQKWKVSSDLRERIHALARKLMRAAFQLGVVTSIASGFMTNVEALLSAVEMGHAGNSTTHKEDARLSVARIIENLSACHRELLRLVSSSSSSGGRRTSHEPTHMASIASMGSEIEEVRSVLIEHRSTLSNTSGETCFTWIDGPLVTAMQKGHWIVLDGANLCNPSILDRLNPLLEPSGSLLLNECGLTTGEAREIIPDSRFRIFLSTDPQYGEVSRAMRNRGIEVYLLDEDVELPGPSPGGDVSSPLKPFSRVSTADLERSLSSSRDTNLASTQLFVEACSDIVQSSAEDGPFETTDALLRGADLLMALADRGLSCTSSVIEALVHDQLTAGSRLSESDGKRSIASRDEFDLKSVFESKSARACVASSAVVHDIGYSWPFATSPHSLASEPALHACRKLALPSQLISSIHSLGICLENTDASNLRIGPGSMVYTICGRALHGFHRLNAALHGTSSPHTEEGDDDIDGRIPQGDMNGQRGNIGTNALALSGISKQVSLLRRLVLTSMSIALSSCSSVEEMESFVVHLRAMRNSSMPSSSSSLCTGQHHHRSLHNDILIALEDIFDVIDSNVYTACIDTATRLRLMHAKLDVSVVAGLTAYTEQSVLPESGAKMDLNSLLMPFDIACWNGLVCSSASACVISAMTKPLCCNTFPGTVPLVELGAAAHAGKSSIDVSAFVAYHLHQHFAQQSAVEYVDLKRIRAAAAIDEDRSLARYALCGEDTEQQSIHPSNLNSEYASVRVAHAAVALTRAFRDLLNEYILAMNSGGNAWIKHAQYVWGIHVARCFLWRLCVRQENDDDAAIDITTGLTFAGIYCLKLLRGAPEGITAEVKERHPQLAERLQSVEEALLDFGRTNTRIGFLAHEPETPSCYSSVLQSDEFSPVLWERGGWISVSRRIDVTESFVDLERVCDNIRVGAYDNEHPSCDADDIFSLSNHDMEDAQEEQTGVRAIGRAFAISSEVRDAAAEALALLRADSFQRRLLFSAEDAIRRRDGFGVEEPAYEAVSSEVTMSAAADIIERVKRMGTKDATIEFESVGLEETHTLRLPADYLSATSSLRANAMIDERDVTFRASASMSLPFLRLAQTQLFALEEFRCLSRSGLLMIEMAAFIQSGDGAALRRLLLLAEKTLRSGIRDSPRSAADFVWLKLLFFMGEHTDRVRDIIECVVQDGWFRFHQSCFRNLLDGPAALLDKSHYVADNSAHSAHGMFAHLAQEQQQRQRQPDSHAGGDGHSEHYGPARLFQATETAVVSSIATGNIEAHHMQIKLAQLMAARNSIRGKHDTKTYSLGSECQLAMTVFVDILRAHRTTLLRLDGDFHRELDAFFGDLLANYGEEESDLHNRSLETYVERIQRFSMRSTSSRFSEAMKIHGEVCVRALVRAKHGTDTRKYVDIAEAWLYIGLIRMSLVDPPRADPAARFLVDEDMLNMQEALAEEEKCVREALAGFPMSVGHDFATRELATRIEAIQRARRAIDARIVARPPRSQYFDIGKEVARITQSLTSPDRVKHLFDSLRDNGVRSVGEACAWQLSVDSAIQRLLRDYPLYGDIVQPICLSMYEIRRGLSLLQASRTHVAMDVDDVSRAVTSLMSVPEVRYEHSASSASLLLTDGVLKQLGNTEASIDGANAVKVIKLKLRLCVASLRRVLRWSSIRGRLAPTDFDTVHEILSTVSEAWMRCKSAVDRAEKEEESNLDVDEDEEERSFKNAFPDFYESFRDLEDRYELERIGGTDLASDGDQNASVSCASVDSDIKRLKKFIQESVLPEVVAAHRHIFVENSPSSSSSSPLSSATRFNMSSMTLVSHACDEHQLGIELFFLGGGIAGSSLDAEAAQGHCLRLSSEYLRSLRRDRQDEDDKPTPQKARGGRIGSKYAKQSPGNGTGHKDSSSALEQNVETVLEIPSLVEPVTRVRRRVLGIMTEFPDNPLLCYIEELCLRLLRLSIHAPLRQAVAGIELLLARIQSWEETSPKRLHVGEPARACLLLATRWRAIDVRSYPAVLRRTENRHVEAAGLSWASMYAVLHSKGAGDHSTSSAATIAATLEQFIQGSPLGQFRARMDLLWQFACQLSTRYSDSESKGKACTSSFFLLRRLLFNMCMYYEQFAQSVHEQLERLRAPIEKELKDFVRLAKWEDRGYYAQRQNVEKSQRILHRLDRRLDALLDSGVTEILLPENYKVTMEDLGVHATDAKEFCGADALTDDAMTVPGFPAILVRRSREHMSALCRESTHVTTATAVTATAHFPEGSYAQRCGSLAKRMHELLSPMMFSEDVDSVWHEGPIAVESVVEEIFARVESLKENKDVTLAHKKKALSDLLRGLKDLGFSHLKSKIPKSERLPMTWLSTDDSPILDELAATSSPAMVFCPSSVDTRDFTSSATDTTEVMTETWRRATNYFFRCISRVHKLWALVSSPHPDIAAAESQKLVAFTEHIIFIQRQQRKRVVDMASALSRLRRLSSLAASITDEDKESDQATSCFAVPLSQARASAWLSTQRDMLSSINLTLMEMSVALENELACDECADIVAGIGATSTAKSPSSTSLHSWKHFVDRAKMTVATSLREITSVTERHMCTIQMEEEVLCTRATLHMLRTTFHSLRSIRSELSTSTDGGVAKWRCSVLQDLLDHAAREHDAFEIECNGIAATHDDKKHPVVDASVHSPETTLRAGENCIATLLLACQHVMKLTSSRVHGSNIGAANGGWTTSVDVLMEKVKDIDVSAQDSAGDGNSGPDASQFRRLISVPEVSEELSDLFCAHKVMQACEQLETLLTSIFSWSSLPAFSGSLPAASALLRRLLPFLDTYATYCQWVLLHTVRLHKSTAKLGLVTASLSSNIILHGFCRTKDDDDNGDDANGANTGQFHEAGGTGMGEGEGKKDVSDQIENEDQIVGTEKNEEEKDDPNKPPDDDDAKGIEMQHDFEGTMHDVEPDDDNDNDDDADKDDGDDERLDQEVGDAGKNAEVVDEKMWGGDPPPETGDEKTAGIDDKPVEIADTDQLEYQAGQDDEQQPQQPQKQGEDDRAPEKDDGGDHPEDEDNTTAAQDQTECGTQDERRKDFVEPEGIDDGELPEHMDLDEGDDDDGGGGSDDNADDDDDKTDPRATTSDAHFDHEDDGMDNETDDKKDGADGADGADVKSQGDDSDNSGDNEEAGTERKEVLPDDAENDIDEDNADDERDLDNDVIGDDHRNKQGEAGGDRSGAAAENEDEDAHQKAKAQQKGDEEEDVDGRSKEEGDNEDDTRARDGGTKASEQEEEELRRQDGTECGADVGMEDAEGDDPANRDNVVADVNNTDAEGATLQPIEKQSGGDDVNDASTEEDAFKNVGSDQRRSLGDALRGWESRMELIDNQIAQIDENNASTEKKEDAPEQGKDDAVGRGPHEFVSDADNDATAQALAAATSEQAKGLEQDGGDAADDDENGVNDDDDEAVNASLDEKKEKRRLDEQKPSVVDDVAPLPKSRKTPRERRDDDIPADHEEDAPQTEDDTAKDDNDDDMETDVDPAAEVDLTLGRGDDAVAMNLDMLVKEDMNAEDMDDDENAGATVPEDDVVNMTCEGDERDRFDRLELARGLWLECEAATALSASELAEQLRLILEPTEATRLTGDFKTGKRLNMRRVIGFIASQYRKNKIWLRRNRPDRRRYNVLLAVDNSKSMDDGGCGRAALDAAALLTQAMTRLEIGDVGAVRFGGLGGVRVIHEPGTPFTAASGAELVSQLQFDLDNTIADSPMLQLVNGLGPMLDSAANAQPARNVDVLMQQLVLVLADGRIHENKEDLQRAVRGLCFRPGVLVVFIILDSDARHSIVDMQSVTFEGGKPSFVRYLDSFPFPYYIILKDMSELPRTLADLLKQWVEVSLSA